MSEREPTSEEDPALKVFREEISKLKEKIKEPGGIHLKEVNPEHLTSDDMIIYQRLKNEQLENESFRNYRSPIDEEYASLLGKEPLEFEKGVSQEIKNSPIYSREHFISWIAQELGKQILAQQFREREKDQK